MRKSLIGDAQDVAIPCRAIERPVNIVTRTHRGNMAKVVKRPYEDLPDAELLATWRKRDDEYTDFYMVPRLEGKIVDFKRSQAHCEKLDRLEEEIKFRNLTPP
jgi:hypothetical protein